VAAEGFGAMAWRLGLLALLALALGFVAARAGGAVIAGPMGRLADDAGRIARGELSRARVISAAGEVWQLTKVFARMKERLQEIITELGQAGRGIFTATGGLERAATRYARSATEQAAALNQTSATTEELAQSARQISTSAASVQDIARRTLEAAESGQGSTFAFRAAVERMRQDNTSISGAVERLQDRVHQIGRIVEVINQVSERSDLLALSAELEGTRAGEAGRGFSLVSSEMRRLAENVLESTAEVEGLISEIRQATRQTAEATARATALSGRGAALAGDVTEALTQVAELASQTANAARTISLATQQQQSGTDQLAEAMGDILSLTQQGAEASGRVGAAQGRLSTLAGTLSSLVDRFRLIP
jgi:methyl-accepting chemotaxis protein